MTFVYALVALIALYTIFCLAPSVVMFFCVFRRGGAMYPEKRKKEKNYYLPFAEKRKAAEEKILALPAEELSFRAPDGLTLKADYISGGYRRTAVLFHGYRATPLSNCGCFAAALWDAGYNLLLVHQRAHSNSEGRYTTLGLRERDDSIAWVQRAAAMEGIESVVAGGVSMGASALAFAADKFNEPKLRALVLDCGFSSLYEQLSWDSQKMHVPGWMVMPPLRLLYRLSFGGEMKASAADSLAATRLPCMVLHGREDKSVLPEHGEKIFAACGGEKEAIFLPGAAHTCVLLQGGEEVERKVLSFLERCTKENGGV